METLNTLMEIPQGSSLVLELFTDGGLDNLLDEVTKEARSIVPDVKTDKGRKAIAAMAFKVAKSKTYLDGLGKDLVTDWKTKAKAVDVERKKMRDTLDELKEEVRKPLTDWEQAEEDRIRKHEDRLQGMQDTALEAAEKWMDLPAKEMAAYLKTIEGIKIDESWQEYATIAAQAKDAAVTSIKESIAKREKYDAEQAELEQLRKDKEASEQKEREDQLRREGEEKARNQAVLNAAAVARQEKEARDAEAKKAAEEKARIEEDKRIAINAKEDAERRAKEAEAESERKAEQAAKDERDRIESERIAEEAAAKKREADKKHRAKINNAAVDALVLAGLTKGYAKTAVVAIAKAQIPYIRIDY